MKLGMSTLSPSSASFWFSSSLGGAAIVMPSLFLNSVVVVCSSLLSSDFFSPSFLFSLSRLSLFFSPLSLAWAFVAVGCSPASVERLVECALAFDELDDDPQAAPNSRRNAIAHAARWPGFRARERRGDG